ncbi:MAG TPA: hypothetical protein VIX14_13825 [Terriglobales bacterium]
MAIKMRRYPRASLAPLFTLLLFALAMLLSVGTTLSGQTAPTAQTPPSPPTANPPIVARPIPGPPESNPPDDITRREVTEMDRFLDAHPEIDQQLRKDPSLIDNQKWVANHPALQEYLQNHPQVAGAFRSNPNAFMHDENRYDRQTDINHRDLAEMDRFMDSHPEIAEQLRKDPSLIDNRQWVANHPALQEYLQSHPQVAEAFRSDPNAFMRNEDRYDRNDGDRDRDDRMNARGGDDRNRGELTGFGQFLGGHSGVAAELAKDPSLANNKEYLATHPELGEYLKAHPTMSQQLAENPQAVMTSSWVQQGSGIDVTAKPAMAKPKSTPNQ